MKKLAVIALMILAYLPAQAQDLHFSQFYENNIMRNPGLTGIFSGDYKIGVDYRRQWGSITVPFQTVMLNGETKIRINDVNDYVSIGLAAMYDHAGRTGFNSYYLYPALNYNKSLEDDKQSYLSVGVAAGYVQRSVNGTRMVFGDQFVNGAYQQTNTSAENITGNRTQYLDLGVGVSFNSALGAAHQVNYYLGASAYHINRPKVEFNTSDIYFKMPVKWSANAGMQWMVQEHAVLSAYGNYMRQGANQEIIFGVLASYRTIDMDKKKIAAIYGGVFYRVGDAWIPTIKVDYKNLGFTFSYDVNTSALKTASSTQGGFEISIYAKGFLNSGPFATDKVRCPRFENVINNPEF